MSSLHRFTCIVSAMLLPVSALAQVGAIGAATSVTRQSAAQALATDAAQYANSDNLSLEEASQRLRVQTGLDRIVSQLRATYSTRLAGISLGEKPVFQLVVKLTGIRPVPNQQVIVAGVKVPITFTYGARATLAQLILASSRHVARLQRALPGMQALGTDERTGELVAMVYGARIAAEPLSKMLGVPFRIDMVSSPAKDTSIRGGAQTSGATEICTTGYVVQDTSGFNGVTAAAHCGSQTTYLDPFGETDPLTLLTLTQTKDSYRDVEILSSSVSVAPEFFADSSTIRTLTDQRYYSSIYVGSGICHNGRTTGYSCGKVTMTNVAPTYPGACGTETCTNTWVIASGPDLKCYNGDSGGPVFLSTVAIGLQKGATTSGPNAGQCESMIFQSTDYLPNDWFLLFG